MPPLDAILDDPQLCLPEEPFRYQKQGIAWLMQRDCALLADEMGLGKTMQAIIAARLLWRDKAINSILVVCPKTLIPNWRREFVLWWPHVRDYIREYDAASMPRRWLLGLTSEAVIVKIINYDALARELDWLKNELPFHDLVIIDEAQRIKNRDSATARAVKALPAKRRWALTGTPLENRIDDVLSIFEFLIPGLLKSDDPAYVRRQIAPYLLRRTTEEVLPDLPPKIEQDLDIELGPNQREAYDRAERDGVVRLNAMGESVTIQHVFQLISLLRQICNVDPVSDESTKLDRLMADLEEIADSGRKTLVFSQFTNERGITWLEGKLTPYQPLALHGGVAPARRESLVQRFIDQNQHKVMLLNYAVGGLGLNLHAANYVYLFDRWWNPAVEDQAVKRAHRLGQSDRVFVQRFVCKGTIEERILQTLRRKRALFTAVIDESRAETIGLSEEEVFGLFDDLHVRPRRRSAPAAPPRLVLENLGPEQFEILVSDIYKAEGFTVRVTGRSHDGGVDLVAERDRELGREKVVVQCKHQTSPVGRPVVQQLLGVVQHDPSVTQGHLVTTSTFSRPAVEFAQGTRLRLINREKLAQLAERHKIAIFIQP